MLDANRSTVLDDLDAKRSVVTNSTRQLRNRVSARQRIETRASHRLKSVLLVLLFEDFADADEADVHNGEYEIELRVVNVNFLS